MVTITFDGDTLSLNVLNTREAIDEIKQAFKTADFYRSPTGKVQHSLSNAFSERVFSWST